MTTTFPLTRIQRLRKQAAQAARDGEIDPPQGWSKSTVDPMDVLAVFKPLRIKGGFVLRAYQFREGGNGNGFVWAMPTDAPFPEPEDCPRLDHVFLLPPKPPAALDDVMDAIEGDGTPWSYLCASLFCREIHEFGAMWHGANWSTHTILGKDPLKARRSRRGRLDEPSAPREQWTWAEPEPVEWKPKVAENGDSINVVFFTFSGLGQETIFRHTDTFRRGSYRLVTDRQEIATGAGGYVC